MLLFTEPNVMSDEPGGRVALTSTMSGLVVLLVGFLVGLVVGLVRLVDMSGLVVFVVSLVGGMAVLVVNWVVGLMVSLVGGEAEEE